ncbi:MAG: T9SS type A sorting domain-containing protein [Lewinella sp.]|nr:T9SS type A sorting domain-containing protein [Lewinella sp.]
MYAFLIISVILTGKAISQPIHFNDAELKRYLTTEGCALTNTSGSTYVSPDLNNDGEIQLSEANEVVALHITDLIPSNYFIRSIADLDHFSGLQDLTLISLDSLEGIFQPSLNDLHSLFLESCKHARHIDISNLTNLTISLRLEGIDTIDYLNIQNGHVANFFSLFYSEHIHYACVDSIAAEYEEVAWRMISGLPQTTNCSTTPTTTDRRDFNLIRVFPNPATDGLWVEHPDAILTRLTLFDQLGQPVLDITAPHHIRNWLDIHQLPTGLYLLEAVMADGRIRQKIVKR